MKKQILLFVMVLMVSVPFVSAQKTSFGVLGGLNFQNYTGKDYAGDKLSNDIRLGFHIGANAQIAVAPDFYFQPGLLLSTKGTKESAGSEDAKIRVSYIEMPLNLVYKPLVGKGHFLLGFGPYLGYGISGKISVGDISEDIKFKGTVDSNDAQATYLRAFDAGAGIFAGYELENGVFCQFNTQLGLVKINPGYEGSTGDKSSVKNTGFGLSFGYRF